MSTLEFHITRELTGATAPIKFPARVYRDAGTVVVGAIRLNILEQKTIDEERIKINAPATIEMKRKANLPLYSLIAHGRRLINEGAYRITILPNGVSISATAADIARWVQEKGYVRWFGLRAKHREGVAGVFRKYIREVRAKVEKKTEKA